MDQLIIDLSQKTQWIILLTTEANRLTLLKMVEYLFEMRKGSIVWLYYIS